MTNEQIYYTTLDMERDLFIGVSSVPTPPEVTYYPELPPGTYRVLCGELFRIVEGIPPKEGRT